MSNMEWIAASIVLVALIYFSMKSRQFRRILGGAIALIIAMLSLAALYHFYDNYQFRKKLAISNQLIAKSDVVLSEMTLHRSFDTSLYFYVKGLVSNNSIHPMDQLQLTITIKNCDDSGSNCSIVGQSVATDFFDVPPSQTRQFYGQAKFPDLPELHNWSWTYEIAEVSAPMN